MKAYTFKDTTALFASDGKVVYAYVPQTGRWHLEPDLNAFEMTFPKPGDDDPAKEVKDLPQAIEKCQPLIDFHLHRLARLESKTTAQVFGSKL